MTTFTTEDRLQFEKPQEPTWEEKWGKTWINYVKGLYVGYEQMEIQYFWPLTEQIGLDLDYTESTPPSLSYSIGGTTGLTWSTVPSNIISPQLTITPTNSTGYIQIGGINIGMEKKPNLLQRLIHRLLGFDWKDK